MLIPTIICTVDKRVRFEEPAADTQPQQTPKQVAKPKISACLQPQWCDVRRDYKGRKIIVAHKGPCYGNGPTAEGGGKGGTEDVKKGANGNGSAKECEKKDGKKKDEAKAEKNGNGGGKDGGGGDEKKPYELTPEEDEKLKALKAENKSWKDIAAEMSKPQGILKQRWRVIDPAKAGGDNSHKHGGDDKKTGGDEKKDEEKPAAGEEPKKMTKAEKRAAKRDAKQEEAKAEEKPKSNSGGNGAKPPSKPASKSGSKAGSEARFTMGEWVTLQEDDLFSFGELQLLSELIAQYDLGRWHMVASRFFDKTGRRMHPDDVRDKFVQAGVMG